MNNDVSKLDPFSDNYDPSLSQTGTIEISVCNDCKKIMEGELITKVVEKLEGRQLLCLVIHGSKLYGLDHADSDLDVKGVFIPTKREILLGEFPHVLKYTSGNDNSKNSKDDVDIELYSIYHFFKLACSGDTGAISLLNAPFDKVCSRHPYWDVILENAKLFYCKQMAGLIGFVTTQTSKYCQKGDRLKAAKEAQHFLETYNIGAKCSGVNEKLRDFLGALPISEHAKIIEKDGNTYYSICDRMIQDTSSPEYALGVINSIIKSYGKRAQIAHDNNGLDWKAISHAFRVASELSNIYEFGMIKYPLEDFERIKRIKLGELDFKTEVLPDLNSLMDRVHEMSEKSNFPEVVDTEKVDNLLFSLIKNYIK